MKNSFIIFTFFAKFSRNIAKEAQILARPTEFLVG